MNDRPGRKKLRPLIAALAALGAVVLWLALRSSDPPARPGAGDEPEPEVAAEAARRAAVRTSPTSLRPPPPSEPEHVADDGIPIMPPGPNDPRPEGPVHPHPITAEHRRIFAENRLIGSLNGAMDVKDAAAMRRFLEQYRQEYPDDPNGLQTGYAVVIDCLEHPGPVTRAAAERWAEANRGSTLRRFVNRHCSEEAP